MKNTPDSKKKPYHISNHFAWTAIFAFALITAACSDDSTTNSPNDQACGNGMLDEGEICDGEILSQKAACPEGKQLPSGANFSCNADCSLNTESCISVEVPDSCGNGALDDGEICDGADISQDAACPDGMHLPSDANWSCKADCSLNTDACVPDQDEPIEPCGNGSLDDGEACDGELLSKSASCPEGMHVAEGKDLACNADCTLDISACENDASTTIPQGRVKADEANPELEAVQLHRTPQDVFPNEELYADREDEPSQIVTQIPVGEVVDIVGAVGDRWRVQYKEFEGYIHSMYVERINELEIPAIDYSSLPTPNFYQFDPQWKDLKIGTGTVENQGGVPVTVADAIAAIKQDDSYTPAKIVEGLKANFGKSKDHICKSVPKAYQLECEYIDNTNGMNCGSNKKNDAKVRKTAKAKLQDAIKNGWYIVAEEGEDSSSYWKAHRNVLVYGYDSANDRVYFDDPRNNHYMFEGIEAFLDCNHSMSIIKDICVPKECADLGPDCGELSDGCGGTLNCACTPQGTVLNDNTPYRRSPQDKFSDPEYTDGLLNTTHVSGLDYRPGEPSQIAGKLKKGTEVEILGKVPKNPLKPKDEWYQIYVNKDKKEKYYILVSAFKTNGAEIKSLPYFSGSTLNYAQRDPQWKDKPYSTKNGVKQTMGSDGCGPTSMANVISTLTKHNDINPYTVAQEFMAYGSENNGAPDNPGGGTWANDKMCKIPLITNNKITCKFSSTLDMGEAKKTLQAGGYMVVYQEAGYWTNGGHYITVYGYDEKYFFADDPMGRKYYQDEQGFKDKLRGVAYLTK